MTGAALIGSGNIGTDLMIHVTSEGRNLLLDLYFCYGTQH